MNDFFRILLRSAWEEAQSIPKRPWEWLTALALPALWCGLLMAVFAQGLALPWAWSTKTIPRPRAR